MCYFGGRSYETPWRGVYSVLFVTTKAISTTEKEKRCKRGNKGSGVAKFINGRKRRKRQEDRGGKQVPRGATRTLEPSRLPPLTVMTRRCCTTNSLKPADMQARCKIGERGSQSGMRGFCPKETPAKCRGQFHGLWEKRNSPNSFS